VVFLDLFCLLDCICKRFLGLADQVNIVNFIQNRIGANDGRLWTLYITFGFPKGRIISWPAERPVVPQEGLYWMYYCPHWHCRPWCSRSFTDQWRSERNFRCFDFAHSESDIESKVSNKIFILLSRCRRTAPFEAQPNGSLCE